MKHAPKILALSVLTALALVGLFPAGSAWAQFPPPQPVCPACPFCPAESVPPTPLNARILVAPTDLFFGQDCPTAPVGAPGLVPTKVMTIFNTGGVGVNFSPPWADPGTEDLMVTGIKIVGDDNSVAFVGGTVLTLNPPPVGAQFLENPSSNPSLPTPGFNGTTDCMDVLGNPVPVKSGSSCSIVVFGNRPGSPTGGHSRIVIDSNDTTMPPYYQSLQVHNLFPGGGCTQVAPLKTPPPVNKFLGLSAGQVIGNEVFDKIKCNCSNFDAACRGKPHGVSGAPNVVCTVHTSSCTDCCESYLDWACDQL